MLWYRIIYEESKFEIKIDESKIKVVKICKKEYLNINIKLKEYSLNIKTWNDNIFL